MLVESHADILTGMFWAEVPEAGRRAFDVERGALRTAAHVASSWKCCWSATTRSGGRHPEELLPCLEAKDPEPRRKIATGLAQLAIMFSVRGRPAGFDHPQGRRPDLQGKRFRNCRAC